MRAALGLIALAGCAQAPPRGQIALYLDTDAIIAPSDVPALFDTLEVEVYAPGQSEPCAGCGRTFSVSSTDFRDPRGLSLGVPLPPGVSGYRVRVRLFPRRATLSGEAPSVLPLSVIDVFAALPPVGVDGILERRLFLPTDEVGLPRGSSSAPIELEVGRWSSSRVSTWPRAKRTPCSGEPQLGEVCVPGGAFWMGNPRGLAYLTRKEEPASLDATVSRLVVLSPFFIDADLATAPRFRELGFAADRPWTGGLSGATIGDHCTFTERPGPRDDLPLNCIGRGVARSYCSARGGDLITEAQFEYVASALTGRRYAWGDDPLDACHEAVFGRGGWGIFRDASAPCKTAKPPGGVLAIGSIDGADRRDRLSLPGGTIHDLAGNLQVWARDRWNRQTEPCWSHGGVYEDPVCDEDGVDGATFAYRGGSWLSIHPLPAAYRSFSDGSELDTIGVRCTRSATAE